MTDSQQPEPPPTPVFDVDYEMGGAEDSGSDVAHDEGSVPDSASEDDEEAAGGDAGTLAHQTAGVQQLFKQLRAGVDSGAESGEEDEFEGADTASESGAQTGTDDEDAAVSDDECDADSITDDGADTVADAEGAEEESVRAEWTCVQLLNEFMLSNVSDKAANRLLSLLKNPQFQLAAVPASVRSLKKTVQTYLDSKKLVAEREDAGDDTVPVLHEHEIPLDRVGLHDMGLQGPITFYWQDPRRALQTVLQSSTRAQVARRPVKAKNEEGQR